MNLTKEMQTTQVIRLKDQYDSFVIQYKVIIKEDGKVIAESMANEVLRPDMDISTITDPDIVAAIKYYWTDEKIAAYKASMENTQN